jgi:hypothetical protein
MGGRLGGLGETIGGGAMAAQVLLVLRPLRKKGAPGSPTEAQCVALNPHRGEETHPDRRKIHIDQEFHAVVSSNSRPSASHAA